MLNCKICYEASDHHLFLDIPINHLFNNTLVRCKRICAIQLHILNTNFKSRKKLAGKAITDEYLW